ncbi:MAG: DUF1376 domain-containing protein [Pigmentiphaga sp.]
MPILPYMPFWVSDWLNSPHVVCMSARDRGIYIQLLCRQWMDASCTLPADLGQLASLAGVSEAEMKTAWTVLEDCFKCVGNRIENERCKREWLSATALYEARSRGGKRSGKTRSRKGKRRTEDTSKTLGRQNEDTGMYTPSPSTSTPVPKGTVPKGTESDNQTGAKVKRFQPPTLEEVRAEIAAKGYRVNAERFWHHYEANGWMAGKAKMRSWRSALAKWNCSPDFNGTKRRGQADAQGWIAPPGYEERETW